MPAGSVNSKPSPKATMRDVVGVILAGGKSTRYGKNKALEKAGDKTLIEHVIHTMTSIFDEIFIITNTPWEYQRLGLPMYQDLIKGLGPMGGIYTALKLIDHDAGFVVACDLPCLNSDLIRYMLSISDDYDVVVPRVGWKIEALHGIYGKMCIGPIEECIKKGIYQVIRLFEDVSIRYVEEQEIRRFDPELRSFWNVNHPDELRRILASWQS